MIMKNRVNHPQHIPIYMFSGLLFIPIAGWLLLWAMGLEIAFNLTQSLPGNVYIIKTGEVPSNGEVVAFRAPEKARFFRDHNYLKMIAAEEGDFVSHKDGLVFINGKQKAAILSRTQTGEKLVPGPTGQVPANHIYVLGKHERSYDSRYKSIGFINKNLIIGRAFKLF